MKFFITLLWAAILALGMSGTLGAAEGSANGYLLILSKADREMKVLDYVTLAPVASIPVGEDPHEIALSDDRHTAYVSNPVMNGPGHYIHVVDLQKLTLVNVVDTAPLYIPHGLAFVQGKLWFTAQGAKAVAVYDPQENKMTDVFGTGQDFTHLLHVTPDGNRFYTTNVESGTVSIFTKKGLPPYMPPTGVLPPNAKPRHEWRQTLVDVGAGAEGFDITPDGSTLWTARPDGHIVIVDLTAEKVIGDIDTGVSGLHRLKFTPDGKSAAVVSVKTGDLLFYGVQSRQLENSAAICQGAGIYMDAKSSRMFVSCTPNDTVAVVDLKTRHVVKHIPIGRPDSIMATVQP